MNRYILIRRLRGPAFVLLVGINALLAETHILGWNHSWPFYLILAGVLALAERASVPAPGSMPPPPFAGAPYPGAPYAGAPAPPTQTSTAIVPADPDFEEPEGGRR